MKILVVIKLS